MFSYMRIKSREQYDNIFSFMTIFSINYIKIYTFTFFKKLKSGSNDRSMIYKYITSTILLYNAKTFKIIKPCYSSFNHNDYSLFD